MKKAAIAGLLLSTLVSADVRAQSQEVITTPDSYESIRKTMSQLRRQTARESLEVVIVAPSLARLRVDESEMSEFGSYTVIEHAPEPIGRSFRKVMGHPFP